MAKYLRTQRIYQNAKTEIVVNLDAVVTAAPSEVIPTATNLTTVDGHVVAVDYNYEDFIKLLGDQIA